MVYRRRNHTFAAQIARRADELGIVQVTSARPMMPTPTLVEIVSAFLDAYVENVAARWVRSL